MLGAAVIHVISTGFVAPTKEKCLASVRAQVGVDVVHHYVEAAEQVPPANVLSNVLGVVDTLDPDAVCAWLDGDDWLSHDGALARVQWMHDQGAWVTYGSFRFSDGRPGFAAEYGRDELVRSSAWRATHLKTFRAGLVQRLRPEDREWPRDAAAPWDVVIMFAAIEQAGWERTTFCPEVLYVYNFASSHEWKHGPGEERRWEAEIRRRAPYERLEAL